jgi:4-amino-4-deoxy-L-arabinose transferase-like glycosyltransferase
MQSAATAGQNAALTSLEADASRMAVSLEKGRYLVWVVLTVIYAAGAMLHARGKPFRYDEVFTVMAAAPHNVADSWKAAQKLDSAPPLTHLLTHFAVAWFGQNEISARLPEIAGFWIFCLSLFWFVRHRLGIFYGLAALLIPLSTQAYDYANEA